jgi:hypothetical protein
VHVKMEKLLKLQFNPCRICVLNSIVMIIYLTTHPPTSPLERCVCVLVV